MIAFSRDFESEELIAYEIGYREQPVEWFSWDVALFYNQYEKLQPFRNTPPLPPLGTGFPIFNANDNRGEGYGVELTTQVEVNPCWKVSGGYSFLQLQIHPGSGSLASGVEIEGSSPHNQVFLMSSHDLANDVELDLIGRYVDNLPNQFVPRYISLDVRLAWQPCCCTEFAVVGQNLLDSHHPEFDPTPGGTTPTPPNEIERGVYGMITRKW